MNILPLMAPQVQDAFFNFEIPFVPSYFVWLGYFKSLPPSSETALFCLIYYWYSELQTLKKNS